MGKKLYTTTDDGGIAFYSERRPGDTRIPNYTYDIWMPLLGSDVIGIYAVYCRLERQGTVKGLSMRDLARSCRIGLSKLNRANAELEECGFIRIEKPTGYKRLMHWSTKITVLDPPREISPQIIEKYRADSGYEPLTPWLVGEIASPKSSPESAPLSESAPFTPVPEYPNGYSRSTQMGTPNEDPNGYSNIEPSIIEPSIIVFGDADASPERRILESDNAVEPVQAQGETEPVQAQGETEPIQAQSCLLYTSPSPRDRTRSRMPSSA